MSDVVDISYTVFFVIINWNLIYYICNVLLFFSVFIVIATILMLNKDYHNVDQSFAT